MALEKKSIVDRIEIIENGCVQVRTAIKIMEDGNEINRTFHRHVIAPGDDYSQEDDRVKAICQVTHTPEVIAAYQAMMEANKPVEA